MSVLMTIEEAINNLNKISYGQELISKINSMQKSSKYDKLFAAAKYASTQDDYSDVLDKHNEDVLKNKLIKVESSKDTSTSYAQIGDILWLKIKLNYIKPGKCVFEGYERRPCLVISINSNSTVDVVELTHSSSFLNYPLESIGKISSDNKESYVNIFAIDRDVLTEYEFPAAFNQDGSPMSKKDYIEYKHIGNLVKTDNPDEPYLVNWTYTDNFETRLSDEQYNKIFEKCFSELSAQS